MASNPIDPSFSFRNHRGSRNRSETRSDSNHDSRHSTDSSQVSPTASVAPRNRRRPRQTLSGRSISAPTGTIPELSVPTLSTFKSRKILGDVKPIDDLTTGRPSRSVRIDVPQQKKQMSIVGQEVRSRESSVESMGHQVRNRLPASLSKYWIRERPISSGTNERALPSEGKLPFGRFRGSSTSPRDRWVERYKNSGTVGRRRARSAEPVPQPMAPLRPPISRNVSTLTTPYQVRLEQPFATAVPEISVKKTATTSTNRPRLSITTRTRSALTKGVSHVRHRDHSAPSLLRKKKPPPRALKGSECLHRVTSILYSMGPDSPSPTASYHSAVSSECTLPEKCLRRSNTFRLPAVVRDRIRGRSSNLSYASSYQKASYDAAPLNTPDPDETYRIKRSPSAETEEFIKIDISVRGGTSYLPSEARRIHTPPLPTDWPGQGQGQIKRRGFFFDYTAPYSPPSSPSPSAPHDTTIKPTSTIPAATKTTHQMLQLDLGRAERSPTGATQPTTSPQRYPLVPKGATDWIDTELAKVDAVINKDPVNVQSEVLAATAVPRQNEEGTLRVGHEAALPLPLNERHITAETVPLKADETIPEHLPASPLCPKNRRGRRRGGDVVDGVRGGIGAGNGNGMCWMHGMKKGD